MIVSLLGFALLMNLTNVFMAVRDNNFHSFMGWITASILLAIRIMEVLIAQIV